MILIAEAQGDCHTASPVRSPKWLVTDRKQRVLLSLDSVQILVNGMAPLTFRVGFPTAMSLI